MGKYLLGIDNGNTVCKASLFDLRGGAVALASCKIATLHPKPGFSERNMQELWRATAQTIREVITRAGISPGQILAIGNTGHGNGLYLLDHAGRPLLGITSLDARAASVCKVWRESDLAKKTFPLSFQEFWAAQSNSLLKWVKLNEPALYQKIGSVLLCKDFVNYCLTGQIASDYSDMSATNLMNVATRSYSPELLQEYELEDIHPALPPLRESYEIMGTVSQQAARETGLPAGIPVVTGMLDVDAGMVGSGVVAPGSACVIAGTWSVNTVVSKQPIVNPDLAMSAIFSAPHQWKSVEASATSMSNLDWFITQFCDAEILEAQQKGISVYELCDKKAAVLPLRGDAPFFHPFLHGSNVEANAKAGFYGMAGWHSRTDLLRSLYEGIVFGHASHIEKLTLSGAAFKRIRLTGGGSRSSYLAQLFADVLNRVIEVPARSETGTWGAAISAGIGAGVFAGYQEAAQASVKLRGIYQPNTSLTAFYQNRYQEYRRLVAEMQKSWVRLTSLETLSI